MQKVCVYAICKNEERFVDRFMDSASRADSVIVLDTGSHDDTVARLRKHGAIVTVQVIQPWRFDVARNAAMSLCPRDAILLSLDLDEVITESDWPGRIREHWGGANRGRYTFVWDHRPDGSPGRTFLQQKLHTHDFEWYLPCHEILRPRASHVQERWADIPITVHHYPDASKSRSGYLPLLAMGTRENPENDRLAHYYGRELFYYGRWDDAIDQLERHLRMPHAKWADERCASMMIIAKCLAHLDRSVESESWHMRACGEASWLREPWMEAARFYIANDRFPMAYALAKRALQIAHRTNCYIVRPENWAEGPYDVIATAAFYLGLRREALAASRTANKLAPWDNRIKQNLEILQRRTPDFTKSAEAPRIVAREKWTDNPKFGLLISTYGAVPYVHLSLAVRDRNYPDVPALIVDDCSDHAGKLFRLAKHYNVDFRGNENQMNYTRGDLIAFCYGLHWARRRGLDVLVKMSRRFVPKGDWRPSLRRLIRGTQHATYAGAFDEILGLRTECIAVHVDRWLPKVRTLEQLVKKSSSLWVEDVLHRTAREIMPWGVGEQDGFAVWDFPGAWRWAFSEHRLWHEADDPKDYAALAHEHQLPYSENDYKLSGCEASP